MFDRIGSFASRRWAWIILAWVGLAVLMKLVAPPLGTVLTFDDAAFLSDDAQSALAGDRISEVWPEYDIEDAAAIVLERRGGLTGADESYARALESWLESPSAPEEVDAAHSGLTNRDLRSTMIADDGEALFMLVTFSTPSFEPPTNEAVRVIREHVASTAPPGLAVHVTGEAGIGTDQDRVIRESVERTTLITLALIILILLAIYRSPVAPLVPLITIGFALSVAQGVIALLADAGMQVSSLVETFMVVIVFGAGTDYCLFIISRYREDFAARRDGRVALVATMGVMGAVVASSAGTTMVGFLAQGGARFGLFRTTGPAMAVAVAVTLLAGLTLAPALMRAFGRAMFWPAQPGAEPAGEIEEAPPAPDPLPAGRAVPRLARTAPVAPPGEGGAP